MAEIQKYEERELRDYKKTIDLLAALPNKGKAELSTFSRAITEQTRNRLKLLKECASSSNQDKNMFKLNFTDTLGYGHSSQSIEGYEQARDTTIYHLQHKDNIRDTSHVWNVDITLQNNQLTEIHATKTTTSSDKADVELKLSATFQGGNSHDFDLQYNKKIRT